MIKFDMTHELAIPLKNIVGVYPRDKITPMPITDKFTLGMANLEGKVVPVENTMERYGYILGPEEETYIILLKTNLAEFGLLVPSKFNVVNISKKQIDQVLNTYDEKNYPNILEINIEGKNILILDLNIAYKYGAIDEQIKSYFAQSA